MKILSIHIRGLFELFNYDIAFPEDENVLIITGPNGYGKTMILNIIVNLFSQKFSFFDKLVFSEIRLCLEDGYLIQVIKPVVDGFANTEFSFIQNGRQLDMLSLLHPELLRTMIRPPRRMLGLTAVGNRAEVHPYDEHANLNPEVNRILGLIKVHLIREQRLFKKVPDAKIDGDFPRASGPNRHGRDDWHLCCRDENLAEIVFRESQRQKSGP